MKKILLLFLPLVAVAFSLRFFTYTYPQRDLTAPEIRCLQKGTPLVDKDGFQIVKLGPSCEALQNINQKYVQMVKPIFTQKCLMCHGDSSGQTYPLYVVVPPASWLVAQDLREAKEKMDMNFDFPFQGHGAPKDDLEKVAQVAENGSMPPLQYKALHWQAGLTTQEKKMVLEWVQNSLDEIQNDSERK